MTSRPRLGWTRDDWEDFEERSAIMEYCGSMPREQAEAAAEALINRKVLSRKTTRKIT